MMDCIAERTLNLEISARSAVSAINTEIVFFGVFPVAFLARMSHCMIEKIEMEQCYER